MTTLFDLERMLARSQFALSILFVVGYFGLVIMAGLKIIDGTFVKDVTPFVGIIIYYWFQRQRPTSADDPQATTQGPTTNATPTPTASVTLSPPAA